MKLDSNSTLHRIFDLKRKDDNQVCYIDEIFADFSFLQKIELFKSFFVMNKSSLMMLFMYVSIKERQQIIFQTSFFNFELLQYHYMSRSLEGALKSRLIKK